MTTLSAQFKLAGVILLQIMLLLVQCVVAIFYLISALLMWGPFTYAPATTKIGWFLILITPFVSMYAVGSSSMQRWLRTMLIAVLTFVQLALMLVLIIFA